VLVLDGATGTELERRGAPIELPLWSAHALIHAPDLVRRIHADYVDAGADLLIANTFRTHRRNLDPAGWGDRAAELTRLAVSLAREATEPTEADRRLRAPESAAVPGWADRRVWVLGSAAPLEDCYRPDLVPEDAACRSEHAKHAEHLSAAGADAIVIETMNTVRESIAALRAAKAAGLPALVSFVCWQGARLLSGEPLREALDSVARERPLAVLVNCLPPSNVPACLAELRACGLPFGVYSNLSPSADPAGRVGDGTCDPADFAELAAAWRDAGARLLGGCCGTEPAHIRSLVRRLRS
jgi:S-methylmethionine-dependent homocysteine/selenocysteine methylase